MDFSKSRHLEVSMWFAALIAAPEHTRRIMFRNLVEYECFTIPLGLLETA